MKKLFSLLLSLVMLLNIVASIDFSAFAGTYYESEDNDSYNSADSVPVNSTIYGVCTDAYDDDWYKFTLNSSAKVDVNFSFTRADNSGYWDVEIYKCYSNGSKSELDYERFYCYDGSDSFASLGLPSGTYYICVEARNGAVGKQYGLTVNCTYTTTWEAEFNDDYTTADSLSLGTTYYGVCTDAYDDDWYKFTLNS
ncbi:MAG: hypothetical protein ACI4IN_02290, partial [Eubacterium sp.]